MTHTVVKVILLLLALSFLIVPLAGVDVYGGQTTVTLDLTPSEPPENPPVNPPAGGVVTSRFVITTDDAVKELGYTVNGESNCAELSISGAVKTDIYIQTNPVPDQNKKVVLVSSGSSHDFVNNRFVVTVDPHRYSVTIRVHLAMVDVPVTPTPDPNPDDGGSDPNPNPDDTGGESGSEPETPVNPSVPNVPGRPDVPSVPDTPSTDDPTEPDVPEQPDTPGADEPGSDDYYRPTLPPAGFVYNIAGFIPLAAGFFLLFLLFAFRGNLVYRLLRKQAKKNGHKPEKETLKATAAGVVALIRNEELYPEWRKNSETTARLTADISRVLDETHYPPEIPRGIVVARIIKAAKGRINRHRL